jgi:hypothetical protein
VHGLSGRGEYFLDINEVLADEIFRLFKEMQANALKILDLGKITRNLLISIPS